MARFAGGVKLATVVSIPQSAGIPDEACRTRPAKTTRLHRLQVVVMSWLVLVVSGLLEMVWAIALSRSAGFSRLLPSAVFGVALILSMLGLGYALRSLSVGSAYAVWVGIGVLGTAIAGMVLLGEPASVPRIVCVLLVVAGVIGLKLFH
jgi:quaternary ammonium compound-resistance protein SugE